MPDDEVKNFPLGSINEEPCLCGGAGHTTHLVCIDYEGKKSVLHSGPALNAFILKQVKEDKMTVDEAINKCVRYSISGKVAPVATALCGSTLTLEDMLSALQLVLSDRKPDHAPQRPAL